MDTNFPPTLEVLIRTIENDVYRRPESVIAPLRQLLRECNSREQLCYTYEHLGFAHLLLGENRMARIFYEQALHLDPDNMHVLANLAHAVYESGDKDRGVEYGRRALLLKDEQAMAAGKPEIGKLRAREKRLISFSLYGTAPKYCETAVLNCVAANEHLPAFICRFYVDDSVPASVTRRLREHSAEIVPISGRAAGFPPTFWRFLAVDDEDAGIVLVRDADSIIDSREAYCVSEWIESGKPFHIIRDDCCHTELIHAGLFGVRTGLVGDVEEKIAAFLAAKENQPIGRFSDQLFLRKCIWPIVRTHALTHDSVYRYGTDVRSVPPDVPGSPGIRNQFMGANHANYRLQVSTQGSLERDVLYYLRIIGEAGETVCEYQMDLVNARELQIFLPASYGARVESGKWGYEISSEHARTRSRSVVGRSIR